MAKKKADASSSKTKSAPRGPKKMSKVANSVVSAGDMTEDNKRTSSAAAPRTRGISSEIIGETAGEVWSVLSERGGQTIAGLKKSIDASDELVIAAVGWLAREGKVAFETNGRSVTVTLV